ncbi:MAG: PilX N-terminal domain-containing pilus assembly protein [Bacillota bacterium]
MEKHGGRQRGQAVLLVLMIVLVLSLLGAATLTIASTASRNSTLQRDQIQAYYVAEAGVEYVLNRLIREPAWAAALPNGSSLVLADFAYAGGTIKAVAVHKSVSGEVYSFRVTSSGTFGESKKGLVVQAAFIPPHDGEELSLTIDFWHEQYPVF